MWSWETVNLRVLLIDDEPMQLSLVPLIIKTFDPNLTVDVLSDPRQAFDRATRGKYDCLVIDYSMPELNGVNLIKSIKAVKDIPCILYTGRGSDEVSVAARAAGADETMRKFDNPNDYPILIERIRSLVELRRSRKPVLVRPSSLA